MAVTHSIRSSPLARTRAVPPLVVAALARSHMANSLSKSDRASASACINQLTVEPHLDLLGALLAPRPRAQDEHDRQHGAPEASILQLCRHSLPTWLRPSRHSPQAGTGRGREAGTRAAPEPHKPRAHQATSRLHAASCAWPATARAGPAAPSRGWRRRGPLRTAALRPRCDSFERRATRQGSGHLGLSRECPTTTLSTCSTGLARA